VEQSVSVLVIGAGRMGLRHVRGLAAAGASATVVDPREDARQEALARDGVVAAFGSLDDALAAGSYEAAILAETAQGRLERFAAVAAAGISKVLLEKPVEQSRARLHALADLAAAVHVDARVNHFFRTLPLFEEMRDTGGPFHLTVTGGAFGLACNGIHWLDLARFLSGDDGGKLLFAELDAEPIGSGRGPAFRDYGGRAVYGFGRSRLYLESVAASPAPMHAVVEQPDRQTVLLLHDERALVSARQPGTDLPAYRYGAGFATHSVPAIEEDALWRSTERWILGDGAHPTLAVSAAAHDLLFDLLETSGDTEFAIT
jgi:Oxidoreductase family, NAD-binding Rossmann fold